MSRRKQPSRIVFGIAIGLIFLISTILPANTLKADEAYNYMVRIYAGKEGTFDASASYVSAKGVAGSVEDGGAYVVYRDVTPGDVISFQQDTVRLHAESKYYVSNIRESGKDNFDAEYPQLPAFTVSGDEDYVVAYGMLGSSVAYTVNYVDVNGNALAASQTFYGNVNDKPVIAYRYMDGYFPQAYNLTGTLSENAAENVFTFVYQSVEQVIIPAESEEGEEGQGANGAGGAGANAGAAMPGTGLNGGALPGNPNETQQLIDINNGGVPLVNDGGTNGGGNQQETTEPTDIVDNPTPTANSSHTLPWVLGSVGIAAALALIIWLIVFLAKRRKKSDE